MEAAEASEAELPLEAAVEALAEEPSAVEALVVRQASQQAAVEAL